MMNIEKLLKSKNPLIWVNTKEYMRCEEYIESLGKSLNKKVYVWDTDRQVYNEGEPESTDEPFEFLSSVGNSIFILKDFHAFISEIETWRKLANSLTKCIDNSNSIVILSPIVKIPEEISHYVTLVDYKLPTKTELLEILNKETKNLKLSDNDKAKIVNSGLGLTKYEFISAINLSLVDGTIETSVIYDQKKQLIEKSGTLKIYNSSEGFETLGGMGNMKTFAQKMALSGHGKGILIVGVSGGGKTEFAKRLGHETDRVTICLDFGELMGSYVGETERKTREALSIIDSMSPSIVFIDELEKGLSGTTSTSGDSVSKRQGGQFLTWMQDRLSDTYVVATANDISSLPPEYLRSGRWDAIFFVDIPNSITRRKILEIYKEKYKLLDDDINIESLELTGAEIETLCRLSASLEVSFTEAMTYINPICNSMDEKIKSIRDWSKKYAVQAELELIPTLLKNNIIRKV